MRMKKEIGCLLKEKYKGIETAEFKKDVSRLKNGEPLDYVIGFTEFLGCKIDLSKKPLIPRPETEFWVGEVIRQISNFFHDREKYEKRVLDVFSGSGCVGISIMRHIKNANVIFAEKDKNCISQIKINCQINNRLIRTNKPMMKRFKIIQSDIFSDVRGNFDYIFANPPYIPETRRGKVQKSVLKYEPQKALFAGQDGLFYIKKFLKDAGKFLKEGGKIYMEFDRAQKNQINKLLKLYKYQKWEFHRDQYGKWRYLIVQ